MRSNLYLGLVIIGFLLSACASKFPNPDWAADAQQQSDGNALFELTFKTHGGDALDELNDVNVALSGEWKTLIRKIQPLVTDFKYRVNSEERVFPQQGVYAAFYTGPGGTKKVYRTPETIEVYYNEIESLDEEVLSSTALTADAFHLFTLGPLGLKPWQNQFTRLTDKREGKKTYQRIHVYRTPGFGFSERDEVVLWIDPENNQTTRVQITLEGHSTTKGAHVEVDYLAYTQRGKYLLPTRFFERVNAPIAIDAHAWRLTGLDLNRGLTQSDLQGKRFSPQANQPAKQIEVDK